MINPPMIRTHGFEVIAAPINPAAAPSARKTATCGNPLRSINPESSAEMYDNDTYDCERGGERFGTKCIHLQTTSVGTSDAYIGLNNNAS